MKEYTGDKIRNVAIVGHGGAGTTSLTEALLYRSGAISRMCKVEDGQTTTDLSQRKSSAVFLSVRPLRLLNGTMSRSTSLIPRDLLIS